MCPQVHIDSSRSRHHTIGRDSTRCPVSCDTQRVSERVYAVHTTRPDDVGAVEIVFPTESEARSYAADRSRDYRVLAVAVTEFVVGKLGTRQAVAWFRDGVLQDERARRPGALYPAEPWDRDGSDG